MKKNKRKLARKSAKKSTPGAGTRSRLIAVRFSDFQLEEYELTCAAMKVEPSTKLWEMAMALTGIDIKDHYKAAAKKHRKSLDKLGKLWAQK